MISLPLDAPQWAHELKRQTERELSKRTLPKRSKTSLPKATPEGQEIYITEDKKPAYSDGTDWRWSSDDTKVNP